MTALQIPTLRTRRLRLEPLAATHSAGMFALWSQDEVCRYSGAAEDADGLPINLPAASPADSDRILDFFVRRAGAGLGFRWAMITETDEVFIGALGFNHLGTCPELAWHMIPATWGRGFMTEAAVGVQDLGRYRPQTRRQLVQSRDQEMDELPARLRTISPEVLYSDGGV
eukprot:gene14251-18874_t